MFESVLVDQNPHWDGAVYPEGVPRQVLRRSWSSYEWKSFLRSALSFHRRLFPWSDVGWGLV